MDHNEPVIKACGVLVVRDRPERSFLLMRHSDRWDLPKGHVDGSESEIETALRELFEETGIAAADIEIEPGFRFRTHYPVRLKRYNHRVFRKELVVFLARLVRPVDPVVSEHEGYRWFPWKPPHRIQANTIDSLLEAVDAWWSGRGRAASGAGGN